MKTAEQIRLRIDELTEFMKDARRELAKVQTGADQSVGQAKVRRLEGNIGALEWVLRND